MVFLLNHESGKYVEFLLKYCDIALIDYIGVTLDISLLPIQIILPQIFMKENNPRLFLTIIISIKIIIILVCKTTSETSETTFLSTVGLLFNNV